MKYDREEAYLREKLTDGLHPADVDLWPAGRAAADRRRGAGGHGGVHEPARKPAPVLRPRGQHRVRHHV